MLAPPPDSWYALHPGSSRLVAFYLWHAIASSSRRTYSTGQQSYLRLARSRGFVHDDGSYFPAKLPWLMEWAASIGAKVQVKTIKQYLVHIRSLHRDLYLQHDDCSAPQLQSLLRGVMRWHGVKGKKERLPITRDILHSLLARLPIGDHHTRAWFCVACSGFLRTSEFTTSNSDFDPRANLTRDSVTFHPDMQSAESVSIVLPTSKTDVFREGVTIRLAAIPGSPSCPVAALRALFTASPLPPSSSLFAFADGSHLTRDKSISTVRKYLALIGQDSPKFSGHSWRRGAATAAKLAKISDSDIQLLGRWTSDAFKAYFELPPSHILRVNASLHWAPPSGTTRLSSFVAITPAPASLG